MFTSTNSVSNTFRTFSIGLAALSLSLLPAAAIADGTTKGPPSSIGPGKVVAVQTESPLSSNTAIPTNDAITAPEIQVDTNQDGSVEIDDLYTFMSYWFAQKASIADVNQDGIVNLTDLMEFIQAWLNAYSTSAGTTTGK